MRIKLLFAVITCAVFIFGCSSPKWITTGNTVFKVIQRDEGGSAHYVERYRVDTAFEADIIEQTDNLIIRPKTKSVTRIRYVNDSLIVATKVNSYLPLIDKWYFPEANYTDTAVDKFIYRDIKFGVQALTIPLKFRRSIGNDSLNPAQVETGFNIGFAPGWKFTRNVYRTTKNYLGKNITQYAIAIGPHIGLGATDLNNKSNAPGLLSNRKRPIFTYGGYFLVGINNINAGIAIGWDNVLGTGRKNWLYQGKMWTGIMISLDIIKL